MKGHIITIPHLLIFSLTLFIASCHTTKNTKSADKVTPEAKTWTLKFQRGPCFGECPVYAFYLLSDNTGLVDVHANLLEPGWYSAPLDQEAVHEILMLLEPEEWWHEDLNDQPELADLPLLNLTYRHPQGLRTLRIQNKISGSMSNLFEKLNHLVSEGRWVPTDCRPLETADATQTDVIVQLKEGVDIKQWMKKFDRFGIQLKKRISPHHQYYVVKKDPSMGDSSDFLEYIKLDDDVVDAQWDKSVEQRKE